MPALIALCAAQFMVILDITVVNIALPSIQADLGLAVQDLQWLITAYTLAFGGLLLLGGRAGDLFGRRRLFLAGLGVFTAASAFAALSQSAEVLLGARVAQGVGAAMLSPAALAMVTTIFPEGPQRRRALATWAAVAASGGAFGVLLGGLLSEAFAWRAIFYVNLPIGLAVAVAATRLLPATSGEPHRQLDVAGAILAAASIATLIYALVEAPEVGFGSARTIALLAVAVAGLAAFVWVESRLREPLVDLAVFRRRTTVTALVLMVAGMGTVLSAMFFLTLYLQAVLGHSALQTGLEFLPGAIVLVGAAHGGGHLVSRFGGKPVLAAGMAAAAAGSLVLAGVSAGGSYLADVLPGLLLLDVGVGLAASGVFITGMAGVEDAEAGRVSGLLTTAHELGIAFVLPVLTTIAISQIGDGALHAGAVLDPAVLAGGIGDAFRGAAAIALGAAGLALVVLRRSDVAPGTEVAHAH